MLEGGMKRFAGIEALVIHLSRAEARRPQVERILEACPVPARVIEAVDGRALSQSDLDAVYSRDSLHAPHYPFEMTVGEVGCFLSHRNGWQAILESGRDAGLIIEDDVGIDPQPFERSLDLASQHVQSHGIVQFQVRELREPGPVVVSSGDVRLHRPAIVPLRASCTLYSRNAARHLLDVTARFDRPVDGLVQLHWVTGLRPLVAIPSGVSDRGADIGGTTIQARNVPMFKRLRREVLRPVYRARISALSRRHDQPVA
jgi:glycosyl transferase, family 25